MEHIRSKECPLRGEGGQRKYVSVPGKVFAYLLGTRCCLKTGILMLLSHWGYGIFGFSPTFTLFHTFFAHFHHIHSFLSPHVGPRDNRG